MECNTINGQDFIHYHTEKQRQFFKAFSRDYLNYLGNPNPTPQQLAEVQILLSQAWVLRPICIDNRLTTPEQQCLYLSSLGKSIKEIALFLDLSERQIERYRNSTFQNWNAKISPKPLLKVCVMGS